jgi:hypothetical protein
LNVFCKELGGLRHSSLEEFVATGSDSFERGLDENVGRDAMPL